MQPRRLSLVLDCDGVLTDIWKPGQARLRAFTDKDLQPFTTADTSLDDLRAFAKSFDFHRDIKSFELHGLTPAQRVLILSLWNSDVFRHPCPLCDYTGRLSLDWTTFSLGLSTHSYTGFKEIAEALDSLTSVCDITIHTHIDEQYAEARQQWFDNEIMPYVQNKSKVKLVLDTGTAKQTLKGDIVVEDRLYNLLNAEADCKILRGQFHNGLSPYNKRLWDEFMHSPSTYHKIKPICVSNFSDMLKAILDYATGGDINDKR